MTFITYTGPTNSINRLDDIRAFIAWGEMNGKLRRNDKARSYTSDLYALYTQFCQILDRQPMHAVPFGRTLSELGTTPIRGSRGQTAHGGLQITTW